MEDGTNLLVVAMSWAAQLTVAIFFIAGFVSFYTEVWNRAFSDSERSRTERIWLRVALIVLAIGLGSILHFAGYLGGSTSMMYHNIGLFILVFSLLDEEINFGEYLIRCVALITVWAMHHMGHFMVDRFAISMIILVIILVVVWRFRHTIESRFPLRLLVSSIVAIDFWFTLPTHSASMVMTPAVSIEAVLMFFVMKLSTGRQQNLWAHNEQVAHQANYDRLTNTKNFTAYQKEIFNAFGIARTGHQPLAIAMMDIDHFKLINDQYGHLAGNQVLTEVANALKRVLLQYSENYQLYRTGGEEFTLVFPDSSAQEILAILIHCWRTVRAAEYVYDKDTIKITVSFGLTELVDHDQSPDDVYKRADHSLYISKKNGRDTITVDGKTQQLQDDSKRENYAYFVEGIYTSGRDADERRAANELTLRRYDREKQTWVIPEQRHLNINTRIELMRDVLVNSRCQSIVVSLSIANFLNQTTADKLVKFFNSPNGPEIMYIEIDRIPVLDLLIPMAAFYHESGIKIVLSQIGSNRHFEQVNASLQYIDGIKLTIQSTTDAIGMPPELSKDIQFWGEIATNWKIEFIVAGVADESMFTWLQNQDYVDYLEGPYFGTAELPLLMS
ncbi:GGDEF domain-containing protein [Loigolactobacillus coryniformis]|uniref:GGDEF domain-containing protein n=1 Tax=Loigolactobacillus coryniformis TaxID=1610 RepID=UPI0002D8B0D9|nr:GGDEF domain-containing protein [Loigolactobacillus coryniformis]